MAFRFDRFQVDNASKISLVDGSVALRCNISRTGVQEYQYDDGSTVKEYRPPEEVFSEDALQGFDDVALVVGHPTDPVSPGNWSQLAKGHIDDPSRNGDFVGARCVVKDADTIKRIESGELVELSCGYYVTIDKTPGITPNGERYDQVQRNIIANHVAIGPKGWGRAGSDVRVYLADSRDSERAAYHIGMRTDNNAAPVGATPATAATATVVATAEYERVLGENAALRSQLAAVTKEKTEIEASFDARLAARVKREKMVDAIAKVDSQFKSDGKSDDYIQGMFDRLQAAPAQQAHVHSPNTNAIQTIATEHTNANPSVIHEDGNEIARARQRMIERNQKAGK